MPFNIFGIISTVYADDTCVLTRPLRPVVIDYDAF